MVTDEVPPGYVVIPTLARLWDSVPGEKRLTADQAKSRYVGPVGIRRIMEVLAEPECEVAVKATQFRSGLWMPCRHPVAPDAARCFVHGGPSAAATRAVGEAARLRRENDALREQIEALTR